MELSQHEDSITFKDAVWKSQTSSLNINILNNRSRKSQADSNFNNIHPPAPRPRQARQTAATKKLTLKQHFLTKRHKIDRTLERLVVEGRVRAL